MAETYVVDLSSIRHKDSVSNNIDHADELFLNDFEQQIESTIQKYDLLSKDEKVAVAVSGGKDSTVILHVLHKLGYNIEAVTVDAKIGCYTEKNLENIRVVCGELGIKLNEISFLEEFGSSLCYLISLLESKGHNLKSCTVCGVLRRRLLNKKARQIKANKLVTGHNMDDEAQVAFMNFLRGNIELASRLGPKTGMVENDRFVQRVKPMYLTKEEDVIRYSKLRNFPVHYGKCPCSVTSYRYSIREVFKELNSIMPNAKENLITNFIVLNKHLKTHFKSDSMPNECSSCGEPAKADLCQACKILELVN